MKSIARLKVVWLKNLSFLSGKRCHLSDVCERGRGTLIALLLGRHVEVPSRCRKNQSEQEHFSDFVIPHALELDRARSLRVARAATHRPFLPELRDAVAE